MPRAGRVLSKAGKQNVPRIAGRDPITSFHVTSYSELSPQLKPAGFFIWSGPTAAVSVANVADAQLALGLDNPKHQSDRQKKTDKTCDD